MQWDSQQGDDDLYSVTATAPGTAGAYAFAVRFSLDGGGAWTYCDTDGAGSRPPQGTCSRPTSSGSSR